MKKNKLVNIVLVVIACLSVVLIAKETFAANEPIDITNSITSRNNATNNNVTDITGNNTTKNNTTNNTTANNSSNNSVLKTNNTSNYNNSSLPKTGIEDSIPGVVLVVILGISAVYAYNKIQYYKNI